ncbi:hypothetical protein RFI_04447 [Reticulomyxa filosa]|uniref:Uncharacterized protein n=1 Tax=Reticulomyxa filosa TaxID=46433 RepID=X6P291_RETFI|nr:hypothetical protein RFI_04447 [Reticulomyxa filosa]|eukprot:ETO32670.1 hypothetical protein RFI_04447 [Reticulomyxa filosa]
MVAMPVRRAKRSANNAKCMSFLICKFLTLALNFLTEKLLKGQDGKDNSEEEKEKSFLYHNQYNLQKFQVSLKKKKKVFWKIIEKVIKQRKKNIKDVNVFFIHEIWTPNVFQFTFANTFEDVATSPNSLNND